MKRLRWTHEVRFADCDPARIMFYPRFFILFDRGTESLFRSVGLPWEIMYEDEDLIGLPLLEASATFIKACRMGDTLEVESWIAEWQNKTFIVHHRIHNGGDVALEGREVRVWARRDPDSPKGARAVAIPAYIKGRFEG